LSRFEELVAVVETYQTLAAENYNRIRTLAEAVRSGLCDYIGAPDGICVHLVPPTGQFEPKPYGDRAFSMAPRGFRQLEPIAFGLAVRVSSHADWLRVSMQCRKSGESFVVQIEDGAEYEFRLPMQDTDPVPFYSHVYSHVLNWFSDNIERYKVGEYGAREIGFDFADDIQIQRA
jgi:hypothetical protein